MAIKKRERWMPPFGQTGSGFPELCNTPSGIRRLMERIDGFSYRC